MILFIVKDVPDIFTSNAYSSVKPELNKIKDKLNNAIQIVHILAAFQAAKLGLSLIRYVFTVIFIDVSQFNVTDAKFYMCYLMAT